MNIVMSIFAYRNYSSFAKSLQELVFYGSKLMLGNLTLKNSINVNNSIKVIWGIKVL